MNTKLTITIENRYSKHTSSVSSETNAPRLDEVWEEMITLVPAAFHAAGYDPGQINDLMAEWIGR